MDRTKIITCSYCQTRAILKLAEVAEHHELTCASCGAPIHLMKPLRMDGPKAAERSKPKAYRPMVEAPKKPKKSKKKQKKKKGFWDRFGDIAEDFADDLFDIFD